MIIKFILLLFILLGYFGYLSYEYDLLTGGIGALLTWSFFVLCTPVADAGFLLDFPLRLLFGIKMVISELVVWMIAISVNILALSYFHIYYETTVLTRVLEKIITTPFPYWGIIFLSALGSFISIKIGDELMDVIHHHERNFFHSHQFKLDLILIIFFIAVIFGYYELISDLGIEIE